jgi:hypothetical protein
MTEGGWHRLLRSRLGRKRYLLASRPGAQRPLVFVIQVALVILHKLVGIPRAVQGADRCLWE